ncbi:sorbitol dehydrogenase-like [Limulus polyphemus]|uniref:Sorbitol dehydrogenase n=1 Tax=Limulus polyphemus TaxID=6850 RepID=A0ABM1B9J3_LIMPO|nr:sorbitol dehydrogenase-like [Limulus polyphemus]
MSKNNLSAVLAQKGDLRLEQRPISKPGKDEVLIAIHSVGICGSDVHYWVNGCIGDFIVKEPMVLGHESSGIVKEVGEGVTDLKPGDRVAIEPGIPCRKCKFCKCGRYNLCPDIKFCATPPVHGTLTRFYTHPADLCYKLPDNVSLDEGAMLEPLSCAVHACKRARVTAGMKVLVCGAGPIGILNLLTAKAMGASQVCITDISSSRLEFSRKLGADHTILVDTKDAQALVTKVHEALGGAPDVTIECSGAESSIILTILATKSGGVVVLIGMGPPEVTIPIVSAAVREVDIRGIFRYTNCYPIALDLVASGKVNVKPLITHHFKLEDSLKAFETSKTGEGGAIKVMIHCYQDS